MIEVLFYIAGAVTIVVLFTLWCIVSIERVRKKEKYLHTLLFVGEYKNRSTKLGIEFPR